MTIYVGITQNLELTKKYLLDNHKGIYPDVEMGPYKNKKDALDYILFMKNRFPNTIEIALPDFSCGQTHPEKWWVFACEHSGNVQ